MNKQSNQEIALIAFLANVDMTHVRRRSLRKKNRFSPEQVGRWVILSAYLKRTPSAPRTQRELAARTGLSLAMVNKLLREIPMKRHQTRPRSEHGQQG